jgi:hypothetical protein
MSEPAASESSPFVLGPLFTVGLSLGIYGLARRRRGALVLAAAAILIDRSPPGRRIAAALRLPAP